MQVHMDTPSIAYYIFLIFNIQYEYSMTHIFQKNSSDALKTAV
jgi:hypothetical protein